MTAYLHLRTEKSRKIESTLKGENVLIEEQNVAL